MSTLSVVNSSRKIAGAVVAGAMASGLFASAGLGAAPTANATCGSIFGLSIGSGCSSTLLSASFAIGDGAQAHATGPLSLAASIGGAQAQADGSLSLALVAGDASTATTSEGSVLNLAWVIGGN